MKNDFGHWIRSRREHNGVSLGQMEARGGPSAPCLSRFERREELPAAMVTAVLAVRAMNLRLAVISRDGMVVYFYFD